MYLKFELWFMLVLFMNSQFWGGIPRNRRVLCRGQIPWNSQSFYSWESLSGFLVKLLVKIVFIQQILPRVLFLLLEAKAQNRFFQFGNLQLTWMRSFTILSLLVEVVVGMYQWTCDLSYDIIENDWWHCAQKKNQKSHEFPLVRQGKPPITSSKNKVRFCLFWSWLNCFTMTVCWIYECLWIYRWREAVVSKCEWLPTKSTMRYQLTPMVSETTCNWFDLSKQCIFDMSDDICLSFSCTEYQNIKIDHIAICHMRHAMVSVLNCFSLFCLICMCLALIGCMCDALYWFELFVFAWFVLML